MIDCTARWAGPRSFSSLYFACICTANAWHSVLMIHTCQKCNLGLNLTSLLLSGRRMSCLRPCTASPTFLAAGQSCRRTSRLCFSEPQSAACMPSMQSESYQAGLLFRGMHAWTTQQMLHPGLQAASLQCYRSFAQGVWASRLLACLNIVTEHQLTY